MRPENCTRCDATPDAPGRYCAPLRCVCGHQECPAHASFIDVRAIPLPELAQAKANTRPKSSWDNRTESTWIDQL